MELLNSPWFSCASYATKSMPVGTLIPRRLSSVPPAWVTEPGPHRPLLSSVAGLGRSCDEFALFSAW